MGLRRLAEDVGTDALLVDHDDIRHPRPDEPELLGEGSDNPCTRVVPGEVEGRAANSADLNLILEPHLMHGIGDGNGRRDVVADDEDDRLPRVQASRPALDEGCLRIPLGKE